MSKVYIPTANIGKAHDADIYSVCITTPYTITCSGDGSIKLWSNNPTTTKINEDGTISSTKIEPDLVKFVDKSGLHHVDAFYSVESNEIGSLLIVAAVSFSGNLYFYKLNNDSHELELLDGLFVDDHDRHLTKKSYWKGKFIKSDDLVISHRFIACDIKGDTYVWKLQIQDEETSKLDLKLSLQGCIASTQPVVATCLDACVSRGLIATGFANGTVIVSQLATLRPLYTFEGYGIQGVESNSSNSVRTLQFSPGGTLLAVGNDSGSFGCVTLYETEFGERIGMLTVPLGAESGTGTGKSGSVGTFAHNGWVFSLCFNPSGEYLVTCGYDAKCRVWDIKTKERVATLNISANDVELEDDILLQDEQGDSMVKPAVFDVCYYAKGVRSSTGSMENDSNEGLCCVCMDRSIRYFREAGH